MSTLISERKKLESIIQPTDCKITTPPSEPQFIPTMTASAGSSNKRRPERKTQKLSAFVV